ncbi:MAG: gamma-glutamyl-gamma-aminobutyrate hydrolase family protein, partial [Oscillospiraceae bacterium]
CRGIQFINAALGGTLWQDIPSQKPSQTEHHQSPPYDVPIHNVTISEGTPLFELLGQSEIRVNSYHHQAVKKLSPKLLPMAYSEDGLIEGVYSPDKKYIMAVQWHPELSYLKDKNSMLIFKSFIEAC